MESHVAIFPSLKPFCNHVEENLNLARNIKDQFAKRLSSSLTCILIFKT